MGERQVSPVTAGFGRRQIRHLQALPPSSKRLDSELLRSVQLYIERQSKRAKQVRSPLPRVSDETLVDGMGVWML